MQRVSRFLTGLMLSALVSTSALASQPILLTDEQLDSISAGYLIVTADALADAIGPATLTDAVTDTNVIVGDPAEDGYVYTVGTGYANALAIGDEVSTFAAVDFDTDEEIVSISYQYQLTTATAADAQPVVLAPHPKAKQHKAKRAHKNKGKKNHKKRKAQNAKKKKHNNRKKQANKRNKKHKNAKKNNRKKSNKKNNRKKQNAKNNRKKQAKKNNRKKQNLKKRNKAKGTAIQLVENQKLRNERVKVRVVTRVKHAPAPAAPASPVL